MKKTVFLLVMVLLTAINMYPQQKVIGYYSSDYNSMPYSAVPYYSLTHICHAFIRPNSDGSLSVRPGFVYRELVETAHINNVKVLISIGGWDTVAAKNFRTIAANPALRQRFVSELTKFCKTNRYDGADIDWEYPDASDNGNYVSLISQLRKSFKASGIPLITAALPSQDFRNGYNIAKLKGLLDWFSIMTYDFAGAWENNAYHNSPLYPSARQTGSINNSMQYYMVKGVPKSKLMIGMSFYGYRMNASDIYEKLSDKVVPSVSYTAAESLKKSPDWQYKWDKASMAPYLQNRAKTQIVTYDDQASVKLKCQYVKKNGFGGAIIWELHKDYDGTKSPLMETVAKNLKSKSVSHKVKR
ncbi:MAG TPA: glycoside hydrolase family 18 protein [Ignavibacteriales bacterium]|nr:glycoside hydrolase family 18 protein [Ignavibacteriales bacterium]